MLRITKIEINKREYDVWTILFRSNILFQTIFLLFYYCRKYNNGNNIDRYITLGNVQNPCHSRVGTSNATMGTSVHHTDRAMMTRKLIGTRERDSSCVPRVLRLERQMDRTKRWDRACVHGHGQVPPRYVLTPDRFRNVSVRLVGRGRTRHFRRG